MALNSMKVGTRLSLGFGLVLTLLLFIAALGVFNMSTIHAKLDMIVTADFRMSTQALFSDVVLPAAFWAEKLDLKRLVLAQDTGSAIVGAVRADYFVGTGPEASQIAGRLKQPLRLWVLWPR